MMAKKMRRRMKRQPSVFHLSVFGQKLILSPAGSYLLRDVLVFWDTDITGGFYDVLGKIGVILGQF